MGRKRCNCNPSNLGIKLNEALENMMQKGPTGGGFIGMASAPKVDGPVLRTQFGNAKVSRSNALVSI
jgi:hypothetical protein